MHIHIYTYMHTYVRVCIHKYRHERKQCHARMDRWMKGCVLVNIHIQIDVYCIHTHNYDRHNPKLSPGAAAAVAIAMAPNGSSEDRDWQGDLSLGYRV